MYTGNELYLLNVVVLLRGSCAALFSIFIQYLLQPSITHFIFVEVFGTSILRNLKDTAVNHCACHVCAVWKQIYFDCAVLSTFDEGL